MPSDRNALLPVKLASLPAESRRSVAAMFRGHMVTVTIKPVHGTVPATYNGLLLSVAKVASAWRVTPVLVIRTTDSPPYDDLAFTAYSVLEIREYIPPADPA